MDSARRRAWIGMAASMGSVVFGIAASTALLVDYTRPEPLFCEEGSGCDAIRRTFFAYPLGVPLPAVGLAGFLAIGVFALGRGGVARALQLGLALVAALAGLSLFFVQVVIGRYCPYCDVADASGVVALVVASWRRGRTDEDRVPEWMSVAGAASLAAAIAVPLLVGVLKKDAALPPVIAAEAVGAPPGVVTVVDFVDFECPFCRRTQANLEPLLKERRDRLRVVRRQVPLASHEHAEDAARAASCGERLGEGDAMADALFAAPVDDLTRDGCEKIAARLGLPLEAYRACVADPKTDAQIEADRAEFKASGGHALPTIWIGKRRMIGTYPREDLGRALDEALAEAAGAKPR